MCIFAIYRSLPVVEEICRALDVQGTVRAFETGTSGRVHTYDCMGQPSRL